MSLHRKLHIWRADWTLHTQLAWKASLSAAELARAERFRKVQHASRFIVTRGLLRVILGQYTAQQPAAIRFHYTDAGKPFIDAPLSFNISHAGHYTVIALTDAETVLGIDIERLSFEVEMEPIVRHYFSPNEQKQWHALAIGERQLAFFRAWTRKEAFIKAVGDGLGMPLQAIEVPLGEQATQFLALPAPYQRQEWFLHLVDMPTDYVGAIAVNTSLDGIHYFDVQSLRL